MVLSLKQRLATLLVPSPLYYRGRVADEATWGSMNFARWTNLCRAAGRRSTSEPMTVCSRFAFSGLVDRVEAFEPNPDYALFALTHVGVACACPRGRAGE